MVVGALNLYRASGVESLRREIRVQGDEESGGGQVELLTEGAEVLGIHLSPTQIEQFRRYHEELARGWNAKVNLTSVTGWKEVQTRHFLDSLTVSLAIPRSLLQSGRFVDVGSGAGFPGIPLKVAFPGLGATLIDSTGKRTAFLLALRDALGMPDVDVRTGRAETLAHDPELRESFDVVLVRAVAAMAAHGGADLALLSHRWHGGRPEEAGR